MRPWAGFSRPSALLSARQVFGRGTACGAARPRSGRGLRPLLGLAWGTVGAGTQASVRSVQSCAPVLINPVPPIQLLPEQLGPRDSLVCTSRYIVTQIHDLYAPRGWPLGFAGHPGLSSLPGKGVSGRCSAHYWERVVETRLSWGARGSFCVFLYLVSLINKQKMS